MAERYALPQSVQVTLARSAKNENHPFAPGDVGHLMKGGTVEIIARSHEFGSLCRYFAPYPTGAKGTQCPDGALVFMPYEIAAALPTLDQLHAELLAQHNRRESFLRVVLGEAA